MNNVNIIAILNKNLSPIDTITVISAWKNTNTGRCKPYDIKKTYLSEKSNLLRLKDYTCAEYKKNLTKISSELLAASQNSSGRNISEQRSVYSWMAVKIKAKTSLKKIAVVNIHTSHVAAEKNKMKLQINKIDVGLTRMSVFNSKRSRLNELKMGRMIDHICICNFNHQFIGASTLDAEKPKKIDRELITLKSDKIINHNYYAVLSEHIEST
ncbi:hypothetical protein BB561_006526 [Smittium simulii]|uniref:Uncharacterized protein n=1 Tax=Smittium simulii TaxID=133385 RepID=A0A2T9Y3C9_9FUNG|nr:hypothetical protein BB561_006526 [Smittium simulii]